MTTFTTEDRLMVQKTPLDTDDIILMIQKIKYGDAVTGELNLLLRLARAVEKAHGIG